MMIVEAMVRSRRGEDLDAKDAGNSITIALGYLFSKLVAAKMLLLPAYLWVWSHWALFDVDAKNPLWWLAAYVMADFMAYWTHRAEHRVAVLWANHLVHHSSKEFTFTTAIRMPWGDALYKPIILFWVPLIGIHPAMFAVIGAIILASGQLQHTTLVGKLGVFDSFLNTPSNHRVHHASNGIYLDKNFGATTVVWDRLFGTYQAELDDVEVIYGITHEIEHQTPLGITTSGPKALLAAMKARQGFRNRFAVLVGSPI
jgi:sterol desaturase/sphingolipid hydroxylase (fatty acid hydroxylase superfamily)